MTEWFVIWSIEHNAWWAPMRQGYTRDVLSAGQYDRYEANEIVHDANIVRVEECMIPVACVECAEPFERIGAMLAELRALEVRVAALEAPELE